MARRFFVFAVSRIHHPWIALFAERALKHEPYIHGPLPLESLRKGYQRLNCNKIEFEKGIWF
jgi:hypothetical protein